jgi:ATP-dependent DNA helicase RecQ
LNKLEKYKKILEQFWGYSDFRLLQDEIIRSVGEGYDTIGLMPTGGGKSITFQVPALATEGICLVVTPLIALMKDQVDNLRDKGIRATAVYSGMSQREILLALENAILGDYKFLYISPERLATELFQTKLKQMKVSLIAVDESHCISQWGYDFRPSYLKIADIRDLLPDVPILALTATATPDVVEDIQRQLKFKNSRVFKKSFERKNISYIVRNTEDKIGQMLKILNAVPGTSIVYVRSRKKTKEIADILKTSGINAEHYHAGLANEDKNRKQEAWKDGTCRIIVATNAFGMGIDKPDVRTVIHLDLPDTIEAYFQEAGRAGRDEKRSYAVLLYNKSDDAKLKKRISDNFPDKKFILNVYSSLCNYFQLGEGSGLNLTFGFKISDFCSIYKFPLIQTFSALKILQQAGYLELTEEVYNGSRLLFTVSKEELYRLNNLESTLEELTNLLLRSYTGLFTEYAYIDEQQLAKRMNASRDAIYESLTILRKMNLLDYIPAKKTPFIFFTHERVDEKQLIIKKEVYEKRKKRFEEKIGKVLKYATEEGRCRSQMLLRYFGEESGQKCGCCDYCLSQKEKSVDTKFAQIRTQIFTALEETTMPLNILVSKIAEDNDSYILDVLRWMRDQNEIKIEADGIIKIVKKEKRS